MVRPVDVAVFAATFATCCEDGTERAVKLALADVAKLRAVDLTALTAEERAALVEICVGAK